MKTPKLLKTDSIQELAEFWDSHDVTEFEGELEEVAEPVFQRPSKKKGRPIEVPLKVREAQTVERMAKLKGLSAQELVREWVLQKIARRSNGQAKKR